MENQNGSKIIVFAERGKGESSQATEKFVGWSRVVLVGRQQEVVFMMYFKIEVTVLQRDRLDVNGE